MGLADFCYFLGGAISVLMVWILIELDREFEENEKRKELAGLNE